MLMLAVQVVLGIVTVLYAAPWQLAIVHQLGAVALFTLIIRARFAALYPKPQRIARG
jgi:heme a synthase